MTQLKKEAHPLVGKLLSQPLESLIISVLHNHKDHENFQREHDIELIGSKTYVRSLSKEA